MVRIFKRRSAREPSLDSVRFDTDGYEARGEPRKGEVRAWVTPEGDSVGLYFIAMSPNLPEVDTLDELGSFYAVSLEPSGGTLVEMSTLRISNCCALRVICKIPQEPSGTTYVGSVTVPFRDFSFVLKVQCEDGGLTGLREAVVMDWRLKDGKVPEVTENGPHMPNWNPDDVGFDLEFPDHPVSRVRRILRRIENSLQLDRDTQNLPTFPLPEGTT